MTDPAVSVLITNTNVKHELTGGEYAQRRAQCEEAAKQLGVPSLREATSELLEKNKSKLPEVVYRRARHVVGEIRRTTDAAREIQAANWDKVGELMYASHYSLKNDYEVSCPELDAIVEIARSIGNQGGVIGCRMTGGGFGGCTVALVRAQYVAEVSARIAADYEARIKIRPTLFVSRPAAGATALPRQS
jgi:galactokinase